MMLIVVPILAFIFFTFLGYITHRWFHSKSSGVFFTAHMNHHLKQYPKNDLLSEKYRDAGKDNTFYYFLLVFSPFIISAIYLATVNFWLGLIILIEMAAVSALNDRLHDAFHIKDTFLKRFDFFRKLRRLHFIHHRDMSSNYGIFSFAWDKVFKTFKER